MLTILRKDLKLRTTPFEDMTVEETAAILINSYKEYRGISRISSAGETVFVKIALEHESDGYFDPKLFVKCGFDLEWERGYPYPFDFYRARVRKHYEHEQACGRRGRTLKDQYNSDFVRALEKLKKLKHRRGEITPRDLKGYAISKLLPTPVLALFPDYIGQADVDEETALMEARAKLISLGLYKEFRDKLREVGIIHAR